MVEKLIISAYAIYPHVASSEGIVNKNWIDILEKKNISTQIISSHCTIDKKKDTTVSKYLSFLVRIYKANKTSFFGVIYRLVNKFFLRLHKRKNVDSFYQYLWLNCQKRKVKSLTELDNKVVWVRVLPMMSILPLHQCKEKPLIININDPLLSNKEGSFTKEEETLLSFKNRTQCWTFPSSKLADFVANKYSLDRNRCFVIPHAMLNQTIIYGDASFVKKEKLKYVYTGTFYKSAFTEEFSSGLQDFSKTELAKDIEFVFILSQYDNHSINWIKETLPNAEILFKLSREEVLEITKQADCVLVVDALSHKNLLKGKFIEAISFGIPILGITYENSVMDNVIKEYGSLSGYQEKEGDILRKLQQITLDLTNDSWRESFYENRKIVMKKISEENVFKATLDISNYAYNRSAWKSGLITEEPVAPLNYNWP